MKIFSPTQFTLLFVIFAALLFYASSIEGNQSYAFQMFDLIPTASEVCLPSSIKFTQTLLTTSIDVGGTYMPTPNVAPSMATVQASLIPTQIGSIVSAAATNVATDGIEQNPSTVKNIQAIDNSKSTFASHYHKIGSVTINTGGSSAGGSLSMEIVTPATRKVSKGSDSVNPAFDQFTGYLTYIYAILFNLYIIYFTTYLFMTL